MIMDYTAVQGLSPCKAFKYLKPNEQYAKILEETKEIGQALVRGDTYNVIEETVDVMAACVTMLYILGLDEAARRYMYRQIDWKNARRGYLDAPDDDVKMQRDSWIMDRMMKRD